MLLHDAPSFDVRPLLAAERSRLVARLRSLDASRWTAATALPGWTVKDIALHLLDDDLGRLSRDRDGDRSGLISAATSHDLVAALNAKNQRWVEAAGGLSRRLVADLLTWSGRQIDAWLRDIDLHADATVTWASDDPVPMWFDLAREFTERWVHHQQLLDALGERDDDLDANADVVLDTFVWAYPHQFRARALPGTTVAVRLGARSWTLTRQPAGWELDPGTPAHPAAELVLSTEQAWRILTNGTIDPNTITRHGPDDLVEPLLAVRAAIV